MQAAGPEAPEEGSPDSPAPPAIGKNDLRVLIVREKKARLSYGPAGLSMRD